MPEPRIRAPHIPSAWENIVQGIKSLNWLFWAIAGTGFALPWATGAGVKFYLQAQGKPTFPWRYFLSPESVLLEIRLGVFWATPFIALGFAAGPLLRTEARVLRWSTRVERAIILACAFVGGAVGAVRTFIGVFWVFDPLYFLLPYFFLPLPAYYVGSMVFGLVVGFGLAACSASIRKVVGARTPPAGH